MGAEGSSEGRPRKKSSKWVLKSVLLLFVILVVLVVFLLPAFISSQWCRGIVLDEINSSIDGEVYFGGLSMSWWEGVRVADFSFKDGAGRASVEMKQITTRPHYGSILTRHFSFGETIIDGPKIQINPAGRRAGEDSGLGGDVQEESEAGVIALPIEEIELVVNNGSLIVAGGVDETVEAEGINSKLALKFVGEHPDGEVKELLANLEAKAELWIEKTEYMGFSVGSIEADVRINDGLLRITSFSSIVNNGRLNFAGEADLRDEPVLLTAGPIQIVEGIEITDEVTRRFLAYLNPVFANAVNISGVVDFSCERLSVPVGGGSKDDIEVIGTVAISHLRLQASDLLGEILSLVGVTERGQDIVVEPTRFVLQGGLLRYDDMQMVVGDNPINFRGVIGLDRSLDMVITLPYTTRGETARIGEEAEGMRITIPLKGTIDRPELDMGRLLEQQLKEQLRERLEEQLEEQLREEIKDRLLESLDGLLKS
jgi:hypothetical protein